MSLVLTNTYEPGEFDRLFRRLASVAEKTVRTRDQLGVAYPAWSVGKDARLNVFLRLHNQVKPTLFVTRALEDHFCRPEWWSDHLGQTPSETQILVELLNLSQFTKIGLLHQSFSTIESFCRAILKAVDATACNGATAAFKTIYEHLLGTRLGLSADDYSVLELLRLLRNTVHNGGVVVHPRGANQKVVFKGRQYDFENEDIVKFADWNSLVDWLDAALVLLEQIVSHPIVANLPAPVQDLSATSHASLP
jgi:hypothetical protein